MNLLGSVSGRRHGELVQQRRPFVPTTNTVRHIDHIQHCEAHCFLIGTCGSEISCILEADAKEGGTAPKPFYRNGRFERQTFILQERVKFCNERNSGAEGRPRAIVPCQGERR